jgi:hypothetical protein
MLPNLPLKRGHPSFKAKCYQIYPSREATPLIRSKCYKIVPSRETTPLFGYIFIAEVVAL